MYPRGSYGFSPFVPSVRYFSDQRVSITEIQTALHPNQELHRINLKCKSSKEFSETFIRAFETRQQLVDLFLDRDRFERRV